MTNQYLTYSQYLPSGLTYSNIFKRTLNFDSAIEVYKNFLEFKNYTSMRFLLLNLTNY